MLSRWVVAPRSTLDGLMELVMLQLEREKEERRGDEMEVEEL